MEISEVREHSAVVVIDGRKSFRGIVEFVSFVDRSGDGIAAAVESHGEQLGDDDCDGLLFGALVEVVSPVSSAIEKRHPAILKSTG
jgi:hypothetical protein